MDSPEAPVTPRFRCPATRFGMPSAFVPHPSRSPTVSRRLFTALLPTVVFANLLASQQLIVVTGGGPNLQNAIRTAAQGDTLLVRAGAYDSIAVTESIRILCEDRAEPRFSRTTRAPALFGRHPRFIGHPARASRSTVSGGFRRFVRTSAAVRQEGWLLAVRPSASPAPPLVADHVSRTPPHVENGIAARTGRGGARVLHRCTTRSGAAGRGGTISSRRAADARLLAIAPRVPEAVDHVALLRQREELLGDRPAGDVPAEAHAANARLPAPLAGLDCDPILPVHRQDMLAQGRRQQASRRCRSARGSAVREKNSEGA